MLVGICVSCLSAFRIVRSHEDPATDGNRHWQNYRANGERGPCRKECPHVSVSRDVYPCGKATWMAMVQIRGMGCFGPGLSEF